MNKLEHQKLYEERHPERVREIKRVARHKARLRILKHYGNVCACCGEHHLEFLTVDHIDGGGNKHRKQVGTGYSFYLWLERNGYPDGYRILCINCNASLGWRGYCPHQREWEGLGLPALLQPASRLDPAPPSLEEGPRTP